MTNTENNHTAPLLLSVREAAKMIGMSESWMKTQVEIPYVRYGRRKLFRPDDLRKSVERNIKGKLVR